MCLSYLLDADLVGNRKKLTSEVSVSDLEYADDMALISDSYESLSYLLKSLDSSCHHIGLTINYKKTKLLAVLPGADAHSPSPISLHPDCDPIEVVPSFEYFGSYLSNNCSMDVEISTRITKASQSYGSLNCILWHQRKIKSSTKLNIFVSVVLSTLLYGLETAVLLELQIHRLHRLLGHILCMDECCLPRKLLVCASPQGRRSVGGQRMRWNDLVLRDLRNCNLDGGLEDTSRR